MKKLLPFIFLFVAIGCSKDDNLNRGEEGYWFVVECTECVMSANYRPASGGPSFQETIGVTESNRLKLEVENIEPDSEIWISATNRAGREFEGGMTAHLYKDGVQMGGNVRSERRDRYGVLTVEHRTRTFK